MIKFLYRTVNNCCLWFRTRNIDRYETGKRIFKDTYLKLKEAKYVTKNGIIQDMNYFIQLLISGFYDLNINSALHPMMLIEPPQGWSLKMKNEMKNLIFDKFNVCAVSFINIIDLLVFYHKIDSGCIIYIQKSNQYLVSIDNGKIKKLISIDQEEEPDEDGIERTPISLPTISFIQEKMKEIENTEKIFLSIGKMDDWLIKTKSFLKKLKGIGFDVNCELEFKGNDGVEIGLIYASTPEFMSKCKFK